MDDLVIMEMIEKMEKTVAAFETSLNKVRTGRANPNMLDVVSVDYYGTPTPVNQIASISIQEGKTLCIKPYDVSSLKDIEKAINMSSLGLPPVNDGSVIRISVPSLTEETRKGYCKDVDKMCEDAKVQIRNHRRDANDQIKKDKSIPEDTAKGMLDDVQKQTDKFIEKIDSISKAKQKEIMTL